MTVIYASMSLVDKPLDAGIRLSISTWKPGSWTNPLACKMLFV